MVEQIRRRVDEAGISRSMIKIEITESMIGREPTYMKEQIERFHTLGFHVWMDDFGSGYSSLDVLQNIDFDLIKFDLHFMRRFADSEKSRKIREIKLDKVGHDKRHGDFDQHENEGNGRKYTCHGYVPHTDSCLSVCDCEFCHSTSPFPMSSGGSEHF
jgi:hypothetical protein